MKARQPIALLPPALIERVAAGEAVERPVAAVKELVENALDASATEVIVEITGGGLQLIRVADDGSGIPAGELALACGRHTTNKLTSSADLEGVQSLGFRGEALASLTAIADVTLISAPTGASAAWQVAFSNGTCVHAAPAVRRTGTTVVVRRLFAGLPGRRKFLSSPSAENGRIAQLIRRYAVVYPQVRFSLQVDSRLVVRTTGSGRIDVAIGESWGQALRRSLLPVPATTAGDFSLAGWIGDRSVTRSTRDGIVLAVNRRPAQLAELRATLEAAYRPLLPRGRHPFAVILIDCPSTAVDPNVHPTKEDVLLRLGQPIAAALARAVRDTLAAAAPQPAAVAWTAGLSQSSLAAPGTATRSRRLREGRSTYSEAPEPPLTGRAIVAELAAMRILGQVHQRLILVEGSRGLYLIDQHRAHERLLYGQLQRATSQAPRQTLVEPIVLELRPEQAERFAGRLAALATLGFQVEHLEGVSYLVHSVPTLDEADHPLAPPQAGDEFWREAALPGEHWLDRLRTSVACRTAIRRGQTLTPPVMQELLYKLARSAAPTVCPHGSPLILEVTADFLARQFDWT